ncbi:MAG: hypothetical protein KGI00_05445 [Candidatus Micrarchaeota archaeon]|nr:hypothetical protein [Candidatus Micrarchaeota archaeon]
MAGFLAGNIANNGHVQITLTNTVLGTANFYTWCGTSAGNYKIFTTSCGTTTESNYLSIGTGSTAFTTSSTGLTAQAGTYTQITGLAYASPTSFFTTTFNIGSSNTISEMGLFTKLSGAYFLMFALTFTGIAQTANVAFGMTIRMAD